MEKPNAAFPRDLAKNTYYKRCFENVLRLGADNNLF